MPETRINAVLYMTTKVSESSSDGRLICLTCPVSRPTSSSVPLAIAIVFGPISDFCPGVGFGPQRSAGGDRKVDRGGRPFVLASRVKCEVAGNEAHAADPCRRLVSRLRRKSRKSGDNQETIERAQHRNTKHSLIPGITFRER
jgi:hypothetical protein